MACDRLFIGYGQTVYVLMNPYISVCCKQFHRLLIPHQQLSGIPSTHSKSVFRRGCFYAESRFQYLPRSRRLRSDRCRAYRIGRPFPERCFDSRSVQHGGYRDGDDTVDR